MALEPGASAASDHVVSDAHTAASVGSGDVDVLATPQLLAWCEGATVAAVATALGSDDTTVGTEVRLEHRRPTPVGGAVRIRATLTGVDGRRLVFEVEAHDEEGPVATGEVERVVLNRTRFMERVSPH